MVFGDSTFNDAVAIVLFKVLNSSELDTSIVLGNGALAWTVLFGMVKIFVGSLLVGVGLSFAYLLILRFAHMREQPRLEILFLIMCAYLTFAIGETLGMSGIIATIFCSILLGIYARPHLSA